MLIGATLLAFGGRLLYGSIRFGSLTSRASEESTFVWAIDLSSPGVHRRTFEQWYSASCHQGILVCGADAVAIDRSLLTGLRLRISINGHKVLDPEDKPSGSGMLTVFWPPGQPHCSIEIEVVSPAPALAEVPHAVSAKYMLCGLERMAVVVGYVISGATLLIGLLLATPAVWRARRPIRSAA